MKTQTKQTGTPVRLAGVIAGMLALASSAAVHAETGRGRAANAVPTYGYEIVNAWPHDRLAFTQGLLFESGKLYESTGNYGTSSVRIVELRTGKVEQQLDLPPRYFAEGLAALNGKLYQLTWRNGLGFIYEQKNLKRIGEFRYRGEGWGLTTDGRSLIMSDGTHRLRFLSPTTFDVRRVVEVYENGRPLTRLNELEYIKGEIYANVWERDVIVRIDPKTGALRGRIDLTGLAPVTRPELVLNGIAYDQERDRLFVTGKLWPKLFEIRVKER